MRRFSTTIFAQHSVATLLRHCFEWLQHCSNIATLCCAKNRRRESSRVTPLHGATRRLLVQNELTDDRVIDTSDDLLLQSR